MGPPDPALERAVRAASEPVSPLRVVFQWRMRERDARYSGRGVARIEGNRARLDLFGPRGEGLLSAVVVGQQVRLPPVAQELDLPPPAMLWGTLGVIVPPPGARLTGTARDEARVWLTYAVGDERVRYELRGDHVRRVRWDGPDRRLSVELDGTTAHDTPERAVFRDYTAYVELVLEAEQVDEVDPYPADIWTPR